MLSFVKCKYHSSASQGVRTDPSQFSILQRGKYGVLAAICFAFVASNLWMHKSADAAMQIIDQYPDPRDSLVFDSLLISTLHNNDPKANFSVSPFNLKVSLALLGTGAQGETRKELETILGNTYTANVFQAIGGASRSLEETNRPDNKDMTSSVGLFVGEKAGLKRMFVSNAMDTFGAKVETIDFSRDSAKSFINAWFDNMTQGKVNQLIERLPSETQFVIGSALNFKAKWARQFDKSATKPTTFNGSKGPQQVEMMSAGGRFHYYETSRLEMAVLLFENSDYGMIFCMPKDGISLTESLPQMISNPSEGCLMGDPYKFGELKVEIPKFEVNSKSDMKPILTTMGLKTALTDKADYGAALSKAVVIDQVAHQVNFKIDETGAEVAAATAVVASSRSADISKPKNIKFDRPFLAILVKEKGFIPLGYALVNHF